MSRVDSVDLVDEVDLVDRVDKRRQCDRPLRPLSPHRPPTAKLQPMPYSYLSQWPRHSSTVSSKRKLPPSNSMVASPSDSTEPGRTEGRAHERRRPAHAVLRPH